MRRDHRFGLFALMFFVFAVVLRANAQQPSCCLRPTDDVAMYTDAAFIAAHDAPIAFHFVPVSGSMVTFKTASGPDARAFLVKSPNPTKRVLFIFHEWWGLNGYIEQEAEKLRKELGDVDVYAIDLFDGKVGTTADEASKISSSAKPERMLQIIQGAIDHIGATSEIETLGWCFGGGWSLQAAFLAGVKCRACVMYYGMPDTTAANLAKLSAPVLGIFAGQDKWITKEKVEAFRRAADNAGKFVEVHTYDADHAFANPSNPHYNQQAKEDADARALKFMREQF